MNSHYLFHYTVEKGESGNDAFFITQPVGKFLTNTQLAAIANKIIIMLAFKIIHILNAAKPH